MEYKHVPVMLDEVIEYLNPKSGGYFIDGTLGGGGYTKAIIERVGEKGRVLAVDLDVLAIENAKLQISNNKNTNIILANDNFKNISKIVEEYFPDEPDIRFDGFVLDLGLSSAQLEDRNRGFSFLEDQPLNMSFGQENERHETTEFILNFYKEDELERIFKEYGEERFAKYIARKIVEYRKAGPITTTGQLVEIILRAVPKKFQHGKTHPTTKTFQALRIETNKELENLELFLPQAINLLKPGGKIVIISFHSLEDRIVKRFFKKESIDCICPASYPVCQCDHKASLKIITKKAILPSTEEVENNPRSRSAKLRAAIKI